MTHEAITASHVLRLLREKHSKDVYVEECKNGPTYSGNHLRMDAWAMTRSWAKPLVTAYEIKVSRSDFTGDKKWPEYLKYCNEFYFVCPKKLIAPEELPGDVGLYVVSSTGNSLIRKKIAGRRNDPLPEKLYRYILMCRAQIQRETHDGQPNIDYWRDWLNQKEERRQLGRSVSKSLREKYNRDVEQVIKENKRLKRDIEDLSGIRDTLEEIGFDRGAVPWQHHVRERLGANIESHFDRSLSSLESACKKFRETIAGM